MSAADRMLAESSTWSFVRAVAVAEAAGEPIGTTTPPARESVRLRPHLSLGFPSSDIASAERLLASSDSEPARIRIETSFMGVYGQASPLSPYATEALFADDAQPARDFLDIFNHRALSLAYRVMTKYRVERRRDHDGRLRALAGTLPDLPVPDMPGGVDMLAIAGLLAQQPRSAAALATALGVWLGGVAVEIEQCRPTWTELPSERLAMMGEANCGLGVDCLGGERILSYTTAFRVRIGPVAGDVFRRFLPGGDGMAAVQALVSEFNADQLDWDVEVRLAADAVPASALGGEARMGWDARLDGRAPDDATILISP